MNHEGKKTIIAALVMLLGPLAAKYGFTDADVQTVLTALTTLGGFVGVVIGRIKAKGPLDNVLGIPVQKPKEDAQ